ncbi:MAG TPA: hypothetical protein VM261_21960 [Kofleriaceae bacterium]|nr:hypothetical protein [Kofleriaceae bacterium]
MAVRFPLFVVVALAPALTACPPRAPSTPAAPTGACLTLPGTSRASLRLGAGGTRLYWYEEVPYYGYEETWSRPRIVEWEIDAAPPRALTDVVGAPYRLLDDGQLVGLGEGGVVVWKDGVAELVSNHDDIDHLEVLGDGRTIVYAAAGAIWEQPLHRTGARKLTNADELIGVDGDALILWRDDALVRREGASGKEQPLPAPAGELVKVLGATMVVRTAEGIALQPAGGGAAKLALAGEWHTHLAPDGVKAWRKDGDRLEAAIITAAGVERVPGVTGAAALVGFVRLPDRRVAYLVGHDVDGDGEVTNADEDDLCIGGADTALAVTPRKAPRRWLAAVPRLEAFAALLGAERWYFSGTGELPRVTFAGGDRRHDRAHRWADVGRAAAAVEDAVGDPTFDVVIEYEDGGRAMAEWDSNAAGRVRWAGVGGALVPDPSAYEVELTTATLVRDDSGAVQCSGTVINRTARALDGLSVDCVGGETDTPIPVYPTSLAPGATGHFTGTTPADSGGALLATVHRPATGERLLTYEPARAARYEAIAGAAAEVVDRARLTIWDWSGGAEVGVVLWGPNDFGSYSDAARTMAAEIAYDVLARIDRSVFLGDPDSALALTIRAGDAAWSYDGRQLLLMPR